MHVGDLKEMLQLAEELMLPDVWILHSHFMPSQSRIKELAKQYSSKCKCLYLNSILIFYSSIMVF